MSPKPIYSYVTANADDEVTDIKEKIKISDHANTGCYCFSNGCQLEKYCKQIIEAGAMQLSQVCTVCPQLFALNLTQKTPGPQDQKGEFYTSGVIKAMLDDHIPCKMLQLNEDDFHVLGTPSQLKAWCTSWPDQPCARVAFGIERTLLSQSMEPIERNIAFVRQLHAQGHQVVLVGGTLGRGCRDRYGPVSLFAVN